MATPDGDYQSTAEDSDFNLTRQRVSGPRCSARSAHLDRAGFFLRDPPARFQRNPPHISHAAKTGSEPDRLIPDPKWPAESILVRLRRFQDPRIGARFCLKIFQQTACFPCCTGSALPDNTTDGQQKPHTKEQKS